MTSIFKALLGLTFVLALTPQVSFAQAPATPPDAAPAPAPAKKKKKSAKAAQATESTTNSAPKPAAPAAASPAPAAGMKAIEPAGAKVAPGETLNFKIEDTSAPAKANTDPVFKFKEHSDTPAPTSPASFTGAIDDDVPFKTYIGYPKNKISVLVVPKNVAATWTLNSQDFNFRSNSLGYGIAYDFVSTPRFQIGVEYVHAQLKLDQGKANPYSFNSSTASYDTYFAKARYCFFGSSNFFQQICPGVDFGNDAYPMLSFVSGSTFKLDRLQDIIAGLNLTYQSPITDSVLFRSTVGYNYGLGMGGTGTMTSKGNSSYYLKIGIGWDFNSRHGIGVDVFWNNRVAKMRDKTKTADDSWTTKSTELGVKLAYVITL